MKEAHHFSKEAQEQTSLNFFELRNMGLEFIQQLSSDVWTDYNAHDPGVTTLEQLCYGLTDVSFRTNFKINDLLTIKNRKAVDANKNGFFPPSEIYKTHPVTSLDLRKSLLDEFNEIQNVWIIPTDNSGVEEQLVIIKRIEILPKLICKDPDKLESDVRTYWSQLRNLGEDVEEVVVLKPKNISIKYDIHLANDDAIEETLSQLFFLIFEHIYGPVERYSFEEMLSAGYSIQEIYTGPKLKRGFIKDKSLGRRRTTLSALDVKQLFTRGKGVLKCEIEDLYFESDVSGKSSGINVLQVSNNEYFHLIDGVIEYDITIANCKRFYDNVTIKINDKKIEFSSILKRKTHLLFFELWAKKYWQDGISKTSDAHFKNDLKGSYLHVDHYYSIQNHFPLIYGIGKEGIPKNASEEQHAKAKQFKAYLLFFEQHFANQLAQLSRLDDFFNIKFDDQDRHTYFSQELNQVPNVNELLAETYSEEADEEEFYFRKNKIYDHLLARFAEDLRPIPIRDSSLDLSINEIEKLEESLKLEELKRKSEYLEHIVSLSANGSKGEDFIATSRKAGLKRNISGLENILLHKTGCTLRSDRMKPRSKYTVSDDSFYIVDHILLREFLKEGKVTYGFKFVDATQQELCSTVADTSWCETEEERLDQLHKLFEILADKSGGIFNGDDPDPELKHLEIIDGETSKVIATFSENYKRKSLLIELNHLFNKRELVHGRSRLKEIEKIRALGISSEKIRGKFGQRRLVFQRKIENLKLRKSPLIIDEDFFNLAISVVLPTTTDKFQDEQFKHYMEELIVERVPTHLKVHILWVDKNQMRSFQKIYHKWEIHKSSGSDLAQISYALYKEILELKRARDYAAN